MTPNASLSPQRWSKMFLAIEQREKKHHNLSKLLVVLHWGLRKDEKPHAVLQYL